ncbi:TlpA family protein disulfide reductase [Robertkochia solimangrovi]|uniref:TlpA family protein disulfide reductase n=1 Tax=Robertkochia solimangrovi TaxID=2213046 RepID=UPI0011803A4A|nr:TlpA disulfide reductase family protein [Robertkochia solimangrovi]TRZ41879.1 hypothetical protein DMZ48_16170 [Robertkochia solimangrovi]
MKNFLLGITAYLGLFSSLFGQDIKGSVGEGYKSLLLTGGSKIIEIETNTKGEFSFTYDKSITGLREFVADRLVFPVYLPGENDLIIEIPEKQSDALKTLKLIGVEGDNSGLIRQLLNYQIERDEKFPLIEAQLFREGPKNFERLMNERLQNILDFTESFIKEQKIRDPHTREYLKLRELVDAHYLFYYYPSDHKRFVPEHKDTIPSNFRDYYKGKIPLDDIAMYKSSSKYAMYVRTILLRKADDRMPDSIQPRSLAYYKAQYEAIKSLEISDYLNRELMTKFCIDYANNTDPEVRKFLTQIIESENASGILYERWLEFVKNDTSLKKGEQAPDFTYNDVNGNPVSLSDFKGKIVYIDLWATWCGPCLRELPALKQVKEKFRDREIVFIGISLDDDHDAWVKKVNANEGDLLSGVQLATGSFECQLNTDYNLNGIPHYILIGKDGELLEKKAPRPSHPELMDLLESSLQ